MTHENVPEPVRSLLTCGTRLPGDIREQILAAGDAAVGPLLAIVGDAALHREDSPGEGYAPIHAVKLLGELGATEAVEPLFDLLDDSRPEEIIYSTLIYGLARLGPAVLEPTLARLEKARSEQAKHNFREVLSRAGVRDEPCLSGCHPSQKVGECRQTCVCCRGASSPSGCRVTGASHLGGAPDALSLGAAPYGPAAGATAAVGHTGRPRDLAGAGDPRWAARGTTGRCAPAQSLGDTSVG